MAFGPPKLIRNNFCSATTVAGSAALPFVISTGAPKERSGEICGVSGHPLEMLGGCQTLEAGCIKVRVQDGVMKVVLFLCNGI